jgi:phosphodiesterase/alkaline phosphatase D-like protein
MIIFGINIYFDIRVDGSVWRNFSMGTLLDLVILDTRHYDRSITGIFLW